MSLDQQQKAGESSDGTEGEGADCRAWLEEFPWQVPLPTQLGNTVSSQFHSQTEFDLLVE